MRRAAMLFALSLASTIAADTRVKVSDLPNHPFTTDLAPNSNLRLYLRSGDVRILARDDNRVTVRYDGGSESNFKDLGLRFDRRSESFATVKLYGGPDRDMHVTIEIPRSVSLFVRMSAGNLELAHFEGDQDIELRAGELSIALGNPKDYSRIHASVLSGGLEAPPLGESHGGLFRSFTRYGPGRFRLSAHVTAGDLTLH